MQQKHKRMKQKYKRMKQKYKRELRKHKRGQRPKKRRQPKRTTESNLRMMTITIVLPPSNLTLASTKLDVCHRLTQRVSPPSLMTATAWPNVCLHQTWWLSPPDPTSVSTKFDDCLRLPGNKVQKTKCSLAPPQSDGALAKEGLWFNRNCFQTLHYTYIQGNKKTCKLYTKPYI